MAVLVNALRDSKILLILVIAASYFVFVYSEDEFMTVIDPPSFCKRLAGNITKTVMKNLGQCGSEMKKNKKKGPGGKDGIGSCSVRCALMRLYLIKEDTVKIPDEDRDAFLVAISRPAFVEVGRIVVADCLETFHSVPEETVKTKCTPYANLMKCMQDNLVFVVQKCSV